MKRSPVFAKEAQQDVERRFTAYHEAAHAVADERVGFGCWYSHIQANGTKLGATKACKEAHDAKTGRKQLTSLYAGYSAEVRAGKRPQIARIGARHDFEKADEIRRDLCPRVTAGGLLREGSSVRQQ